MHTYIDAHMCVYTDSRLIFSTARTALVARSFALWRIHGPTINRFGAPPLCAAQGPSGSLLPTKGVNWPKP